MKKVLPVLLLTIAVVVAIAIAAQGEKATADPEAWQTLNEIVVKNPGVPNRVFYRYWNGHAYFTSMIVLENCGNIPGGGYWAGLTRYYWPGGTSSQSPQWPREWWVGASYTLNTSGARIRNEETSTPKLILLSPCSVQVLTQSPYSNKWVQRETWISPVGNKPPYP
jgi:hypothetical protein